MSFWYPRSRRDPAVHHPGGRVFHMLLMGAASTFGAIGSSASGASGEPLWLVRIGAAIMGLGITWSMLASVRHRPWFTLLTIVMGAAAFSPIVLTMSNDRVRDVMTVGITLGGVLLGAWCATACTKAGMGERFNLRPCASCGRERPLKFGTACPHCGKRPSEVWFWRSVHALGQGIGDDPFPGPRMDRDPHASEGEGLGSPIARWCGLLVAGAACVYCAWLIAYYAEHGMPVSSRRRTGPGGQVLTSVLLAILPAVVLWLTMESSRVGSGAARVARWVVPLVGGAGLVGFLFVMGFVPGSVYFPMLATGAFVLGYGATVVGELRAARGIADAGDGEVRPRCPHCGYERTGLRPNQACPECGKYDG